MTKEQACCQAMHGWQVKKTYDINIPKATVLELEHVKTGAKYVHVACDSKENVFAVAFKTVPTDATGVAHILEHTVLTGSEKYPIRDPFFNMLKRSLQTYINAFTFVDWTAYPMASANKKDFYNLMSVYLDATFFPKLKKLNFLQEGWRHSFDGEKLKYEGVVYNEMKGSMSSVSRHMEEDIIASLHEEAPYHFNSGGDPACIPDLSYDEFRAFHKKHYHPSNAYFYSYGDLSLSDHLQMINKNVLDRFLKSEEVIEIKKETRWSEPKTHKYYYPISKEENTDDKYQVALSWLTCGASEGLEVFSLELLEDILIGNPASPVRKALLDSGLGSDLCDSSGYESEMLDTSFTLGLKDVNEKNTKKIQNIILSCLRDLVKSGIDEELVTAVISSNEIRKKNITNQPYPYGLQVFLNILAPWVHGGSVDEVLHFEKLLETIQNKIKEGNYFENLIKKYFLDNKHRTLLVLAPDENMQDRLESEEGEKLEKIAKSLSSEDKKEIDKNSEALRNLQEEKEDLSCLPSLELEDIDSKMEKIKAEESSSNNNVSIYSKNTSGLLYFTAAYDTSSLDKKLIKLVPLFSYLLPRMGTKQRDYQALAKKIDSLTGGVGTGEQAMRYYGEEQEGVESMIVQSYGLKKNSRAILALIREIVGEFDFSDYKRVKMLLSAMHSQFQASIVDQGHMYAANKALSPFSRSAELTETWHGLEQLSFLNKIKESDGGELNNNLKSLGNYFQKSGNHIALIGEGDSLSEARDSLGNLASTGDKNTVSYQQKDKMRQAYAVSSAVSFVAAAKPVPDLRHEDAPALMVASKILARGFLHNEIREKRGAYGGFAKYDHYEGNWWFGSYRDPHIVSTLEIFGQAKNHMKTGSYSKTEIKEAIISLSTDIDKPGTEVEQTKKAFSRKLMGLDDETRQLFKENLLKVEKEDVARVSEKYLRDNWYDYSVAVISSKEKLEEANEKLGELKLGVSAL